MSQNLAIGIDLGTTYSCVGIWRNGKVEIIPNENGQMTTPSVVSFTENERLIGEAAKNQITRNYKNTIYDAKRLIGRRFNDTSVQNDMKMWPFKVEKDERTNRPLIKVEYKGQIKSFFAEEISAMILLKMKNLAEQYLGKKITDAVITVPAHFNDSQRIATKDAGKIAGLNVLRIINEPTAAAIAYGLDKKELYDYNVLIFDLGGGTFDISILLLEDNVFEVKATIGDTHLGGEDFDNELVNFCMNEFYNETKIDIKDNQKALRRLKIACEKAKRELSSTMETTIDISNLAEGQDFSITISRSEFENLCSELFSKCIMPLTDALFDARLTILDIDEVILVGGSTRIPKIQELVKDFFKGKEPCKSINPDEAVAYGASIQAALLNDNEEFGLERLVLIDVIPLSLGVELVDGSMSVIIKRNKPIPTKNSQTYHTAYEYQTEIPIKIYQGERKKACENHLLGEFTIQGIQIRKKGEVQCEVTFNIDVNSILKVKAVELGTGIKKELVINCKNDNLSDKEIEELIEQARKYEEEDEERIEQIKARVELENHIILYKNDLHFRGIKKEKLKQKLTEISNWIKNNRNTALIEDYKNKIEEIQKFVTELRNN